MPVIYNSKKIIPAPFISIRKEYNTREDGAQIGTVWNISVEGKIVAYKGSPNSSGTFWTTSGYPADETLTDTQMMASIIRKQEALRQLFATEGQTFEAQPWDGSPSLKCNPRVRSIEFPKGGPTSWYDRCDFIINLEADIIYVNGQAQGEDSGDILNYKVSKASEEWNMEPADDLSRTFRLTHTVSANGKRFYDDTGALTQTAWENAKDYVLNKIGLGINSARMECPGVLDATTLQAFNYVRTQHINELGGSFQVTETWICFNPDGVAPAIEEFTVTARTSEDRKTTVNIEGQVKGFEVRNNNTYALTSTRYANADSKWTGTILPALLTRCQNYSGVTLTSTPLSTLVGYNEFSGIITYNYQYDNRPSTSVPGAITESITVIDNNPSDIFASLVVLGRASGPVLQSIGTTTSARRTIQIEAQLPAKTVSSTPSKPNTDSIVLSNRPSGTIVFLSEDNISWSENTGKYSRTTTYTWE